MKHKPITRTIFGHKARFCGESCADGFREDRKHGLIYGSWCDDDGTILGWEEGSVAFNICAYCRHEW